MHNLIINRLSNYNFHFRNSTDRIFWTTFRMYAKINLMKPSVLSNYEADNDFHLMTNSLNIDELVYLKNNESECNSIVKFSALSLSS